MNASRWTRVLLACAALLLGLTLFVPLWRVSLTAPQYPEGIGMRIWAHTVSGAGPNDLQNINGLNHYIGMKTIEPDAIPELRFMPWGIGAMALLGLAFAALGRRRWIIIWSMTLLIAGCVGLFDFWKWEYDYGHNLDLEHAPIKIPGMSYQPPLIGTKQLLNFTATSLPDIGGWLAITSVGLSLLAIFGGRRGKAQGGGSTRVTAATIPASSAAASMVTVGLLALTLAGCSDTPRAVVSGADACATCRMTVDDPRFAGQVKTAKGKIETFDSIECLVSFVNALPASTPPRGVWVSDAAHPGRWIPAATAHFVRNGSLSSPMGRKLAAFDAGTTVAALQTTYGGESLTWASVQSLMVAQASAEIGIGHHRIAALP